MRKLLFVLSLVILIYSAFACQNKAEKAELQQLKAQTEVETQNAAAIKRFIEETDKGNYAAWKEICTADYQYHFPANAKPISLAEHMQLSKSLPAAFPDFHHTVEDLVAQGDKVVFRATLHGTHQGVFLGIPPTGKTIEYTAMGMARCRDGKIAEMWLEADFMGLLQQLGMELKPKEVRN